MAMKWRKHLVFLSSLFFVITLAACGGEEPGENDTEDDPDVNAEEEGCEDSDDCGDEAPHCILNRCFADEAIACEDGDDCSDEMPYCVEGTCFDQCGIDADCPLDSPICDETGTCVADEDDDGQCSNDDDCVGDNYCHERSCVSANFICTLKGCGGQRGVCDPSAGVDGDCVNADSCVGDGECIEDHVCLNRQCVLEEEACADCSDDETCEIVDATSDEVICDNPDIICEAGHRECDGNTLVVCSSDGTIQTNTPCQTGCDPEELRCELTDGAACDAPIEVETGDSYHFTWSEYSNNYDPGPETGCISEADDLRTTGADLTFSLELEPGEAGVVELTTITDYAALYMLDGCETSLTECRTDVGYDVDTSSGQAIRALWYENDGDENETIYVVADSGTGAADLEATIEFTISEQICNPGQPVCSDGELGECATFGTHFRTDPDLACTNGCLSDEPTDAMCAPKAHSACDDAIVFSGDEGESFTYDIIDFHPDETLNTNSCDNRSIGTGRAQSFEGATAYFLAELDANERLNANLASQFDAGLWITTACDDGQCLEASNQDSQVEEAQHIATEDGETVVVVVQAVDASIDAGEFTLDLTVDEPLCEGVDEGDILGCIDDEFLHYCEDANYPIRYNCGGDCEDGQCVEPTGSQCFDTIPFGDGDSYEGSFAAVTADLTPLQCGGDHGVNTPSGSDTIFEIELPEGNQLLQVDLETTSSEAGFYILDECPRPLTSNDVSEHCIDGALPSQGATFFLEDPGTYFLVVDSSNRTDAANFTLNVDIAPGDCVPDSTRCAGGDVERCMEFDDTDGFGYQVDQACVVDCDDSSISCTSPEEANDQCGPGHNYVISSSGQIVDNFDRFNGLHPMLGGHCFSENTQGPDAFYQFQLNNLQGITVDATFDIDGFSSQTVGMYISEDCVAATSECMKAVELQGSDLLEGTLEYYAPQGGTFVLGVYGISDLSSGEFALDFDFFDGDCDPAQDNACDGNTAAQCTEFGTLVETDCPFGCEEGQCLDKQGDLCTRPFDIDEEGSVDSSGTITYNLQDNLGDYTNAYTPYDDDSNSSCTGLGGDGPDVVFAFDGWAGDQVELELDTDYDGALWVTTDCENAGAQCVAGVDEVFGAGTEELSFSVETQNRYFVIADAVQTGATGDFEFNATIEPGSRLDDPTMEIDSDHLWWSLDLDASETTQLEITNDGELPLGFDIDYDADWLELSQDSGQVAGESTESIDATASCSDASGHFETSLVIEPDHPTIDPVEIEVELLCYDESGSLSVSVIGLPGDADHDIEVLNRDEQSQSLPQDGSLSGLEPGYYDIVPKDVTHDGETYEADKVEGVLIKGDETTNTSVSYELDD